MTGVAHPVSGAILVPQSEQPLKGVIVFYHYTVLDKIMFHLILSKMSFNLVRILLQLSLVMAT